MTVTVCQLCHELATCVSRLRLDVAGIGSSKSCDITEGKTGSENELMYSRGLFFTCRTQFQILWVYIVLLVSPLKCDYFFTFLQWWVSASFTATPLIFLKVPMMAYIQDTSLPPPYRKLCLLLVQVWLHCRTLTDMVRNTPLLHHSSWWWFISTGGFLFCSSSMSSS